MSKLQHFRGIELHNTTIEFPWLEKSLEKATRKGMIIGGVSAWLGSIIAIILLS